MQKSMVQTDFNIIKEYSHIIVHLNRQLNYFLPVEFISAKKISDDAAVIWIISKHDKLVLNSYKNYYMGHTKHLSTSSITQILQRISVNCLCIIRVIDKEVFKLGDKVFKKKSLHYPELKEDTELTVTSFTVISFDYIEANLYDYATKKTYSVHANLLIKKNSLNNIEEYDTD